MARPRKPTRLKVIDGTHNSTRDGKGRADEPNVHANRVPEAPSYLDKHERAAWDAFARVIGPNKITTDEDFAAFEMLATAWSQRQHISQALREMKGVYTYESVSKHGVMQRVVPELPALNEVDRKLDRLLSKFGLTPADRSRVKMGRAGSGDGDEDPEGEFGHGV